MVMVKYQLWWTQKIISRTEQILSSGFNIKTLDLKKTVNLFCKDPTQKPNVIEGQIREYVPSAGNIQFKVVTSKKSGLPYLGIQTDSYQIPINPVDAVHKSVQSKM